MKKENSLFIIFSAVIIALLYLISCETPSTKREGSTQPPPVLPTPSPTPTSIERIITARDYLLRGYDEAEGYGLYSYVVLSKKPDTEEQLNQYISLFKAYRAVIQPVKEFVYLGYKKTDLNVTYWLLKIPDPTRISEKETISDWGFFVTNYDYARAQSILSHLERQGQEGPFIISYVAPLSGPNISKSLGRDNILIVDLSKFNESDYHLAFQFYQQKVAQAPETWKKSFDLAGIRLACRSMLINYSESIISLVGFISKTG